MPRYLFSSHDGFGLGHVRRNTVIAHALLDADAAASVTIVTGVEARPAWLHHPHMAAVAVPPLLKDPSGSYRNPGMSFEAAIAAREQLFSAAIDAVAPDWWWSIATPSGSAASSGEASSGPGPVERSPCSVCATS